MVNEIVMPFRLPDPLPAVGWRELRPFIDWWKHQAVLHIEERRFASIQSWLNSKVRQPQRPILNEDLPVVVGSTTQSVPELDARDPWQQNQLEFRFGATSAVFNNSGLPPPLLSLLDTRVRTVHLIDRYLFEDLDAVCRLLGSLTNYAVELHGSSKDKTECREKLREALLAMPTPMRGKFFIYDTKPFHCRVHDRYFGVAKRSQSPAPKPTLAFAIGASFKEFFRPRGRQEYPATIARLEPTALDSVLTALREIKDSSVDVRT